MKRRYIDKNFTAGTLKVLEQADDIIVEYQANGYTLTLRQLYYQFVSRDLLPNTQKAYSRLGGIISDGRLAGLIDWNAIEDRTRALQKLSTWRNPQHVINSAAKFHLLDNWKDQPCRIEVWIEKEALASVFENICQELEVPFFCCRGYTSLSEMHVAAQRLIRWENGGQETVILHFGDHDPSGMDMSRDIQDRLKIFQVQPSFYRLALNMAQVEKYQPPPNPAKVTDSRFTAYQEEYGSESWELDALEPNVLTALVKEAVDELRDENLWDDSINKQEEQRELLAATAKHWKELVQTVQELESPE